MNITFYRSSIVYGLGSTLSLQTLQVKKSKKSNLFAYLKLQHSNSLGFQLSTVAASECVAAAQYVRKHFKETEHKSLSDVM